MRVKLFEGFLSKAKGYAMVKSTWLKTTMFSLGLISMAFILWSARVNQPINYVNSDLLFIFVIFTMGMLLSSVVNIYLLSDHLIRLSKTLIEVITNRFRLDHHSIDQSQKLMSSTPQQATTLDKTVRPTWIADAVVDIVDEKLAQYPYLNSVLTLSIADDAYFACTQMTPHAFKCVLSHLLDDALAALSDDNSPWIHVEVSKVSHQVIVKIKANGRSVSDELLSQIKQGADVTTNTNDDTSGLSGAMQMITSEWHGALDIQTGSTEGTEIIITLPAADVLSHSVAQENTLVIIDEDSSLTDAWMLRGKMRGISVLAANSIATLKEILLVVSADTPIYIDADWRAEFSGAELAKHLAQLGCQNLHLATADHATQLSPMPWIHQVTGKEPCF